MLNNPYVADPQNREFKGYLINGEKIKQVLRLHPGDFIYDNFDTLHVGIQNASGTYSLSNIEALTKVGDCLFFDYTPLTLPDHQCIFFCIYDSVSNEVYHVSNPFFSLTIDDLEKATLLNYKNSINIFNFCYEDDVTFENQIRLPIFQIEDAFEDETEEYRSVTSGQIRTVFSKIDKIVNVEAYYFDEEAHKAMKVASKHDSFFLSSKRFVPRSDYEITNNAQRKTTKGKLSLIDFDFSSYNYK
jgi:hypothetical protein